MMPRNVVLVVLVLMGASACGFSGQAPTSLPLGQRHATIEYVNRKYGFRFDLPASWRGFTIIDQPADREDPTAAVIIRHPRWTEDHQLLDIPIMIFTHRQWRLMEEGKLRVTAAPYDPGEIGRNKKYVFAIPPRFEMDSDPREAETQEVFQILKGHPLHAF